MLKRALVVQMHAHLERFQASADDVPRIDQHQLRRGWSRNRTTASYIQQLASGRPFPVAPNAFRSNILSVARATSRHGHSLISPSFRPVRAPTGRQQLTAASSSSAFMFTKTSFSTSCAATSIPYEDYPYYVFGFRVQRQLIQKGDICTGGRRVADTESGEIRLLRSELTPSGPHVRTSTVRLKSCNDRRERARPTLTEKRRGVLDALVR